MPELLDYAQLRDPADYLLIMCPACGEDVAYDLALDRDSDVDVARCI